MRQLSVDLSVNPNTVSRAYNELELTGLLTHPHTSAGRVPTDKAYRFYIDTLLEVRSLPSQEEREIMNYPLPMEDFHQLMQETSRLLSALSHYAGVVMAPKPAETVYKQIEFIRLSGQRVLAIFVSGAGIVHNRIVRLEDDLTQKELEQLSGFLNREMSGRSLRDIRARVVSMMEEEKNSYTKLLVKLMKVWSEAAPADDETEGELFVGGLSEMFNIPDFRDIEKISMALAPLGPIFEPENPVTHLIIDHRTGRMKEEILDEKVLSAIIELKTGMEKLPAFLAALGKVQHEIDTVISVGVASRCLPDGTIPHEELVRNAGYILSQTGKTNLGLGRPLFKEDEP